MPETTVTASDNGRAIEVASGDELIIEVSENPTTGFRWALDGALPDGLSLTASDFEAGGSAPGAGGKRRLRLRASGAGGGSVGLKLWREWQGDASITQRFSVIVSVRG